MADTPKLPPMPEPEITDEQLTSVRPLATHHKASPPRFHGDEWRNEKCWNAAAVLAAQRAAIRLAALPAQQSIEQARELSDEAVRAAMGEGWPFDVERGGSLTPAKIWRHYEHTVKVQQELMRELSFCAQRIHNQRAEINRLIDAARSTQPPKGAADV